MSVFGPTTERVKVVASHGSRVSEPCVGCVRVAGVQDGWGDEEASPVMHAVLGGCATEDETRLRTLSYLSGNLSVRMMLARVVQLGATYTGPRFEFVAACTGRKLEVAFPSIAGVPESVPSPNLVALDATLYPLPSYPPTMRTSPPRGESDLVSASRTPRLSRCDVFSRADVEPPRQIGAPGPVRIGYVRRGHEVRVDVGLEAGPVVGEAVQATASDPRHPPVEVATTTNSTVAIRAGYKPDGEDPSWQLVIDEGEEAACTRRRMVVASSITTGATGSAPSPNLAALAVTPPPLPSSTLAMADVEPPRSIGAPGAAGIADVRHTPDIRVDVERAADPGFGEVAQASPSDAMHPPAAVAAESVEPSRPIGASVAVDIVNIRQRSAVRGGVGLAANPVVGEAAQSSSYDANHPPVAVATESMAPSRPIGAPDAAGIADVRQSQHGRSGVELVAGPVSGEAAQVSLSNLQLLLVAVATESVEPSRRIGAPDAADIEDGRQSLTVRGDVGLAADPTVGEAAQSSSSDASHPPVAVTTTSNPMMSICVGYKPDDEDNLSTLVASFKRMFGGTFEVDTQSRIVSMTGQGKGNMPQKAARCLDHALRVCREGGFQAR
eukprot:jgi/Undpi1/12828/HiC_scaffold_7.g02495.m1